MSFRCSRYCNEMFEFSYTFMCAKIAEDRGTHTKNQIELNCLGNEDKQHETSTFACNSRFKFERIFLSAWRLCMNHITCIPRFMLSFRFTGKMLSSFDQRNNTEVPQRARNFYPHIFIFQTELCAHTAELSCTRNFGGMKICSAQYRGWLSKFEEYVCTSRLCWCASCHFKAWRESSGTLFRYFYFASL